MKKNLFVGLRYYNNALRNLEIPQAGVLQVYTLIDNYPV